MPQGNVSTNSPQKRPQPLRRKAWKSQKELGQILEFHRVGRPPQINVDRMVALGRQGMTCSEIAQEMSCSKQYVSRWLHRLLADEGPGRHDPGIPILLLFSGISRIKIHKLGDEISLIGLDDEPDDRDWKDKFLNFEAYDRDNTQEIAQEETGGGWCDDRRQYRRQTWDATHGGGK